MPKNTHPSDLPIGPSPLPRLLPAPPGHPPPARCPLMRRELLWLPHTAAALACCALLQRALIFFTTTPTAGHGRPHAAVAFFLIHDASPAQVRGKTESPRRHLSFLPNSKTSRALNHRQSDLQEAPICQPCPPAMEFPVELSLWGHNFSFLGSKNREVLEIDFFSASPYLFGELANKF